MIRILFDNNLDGRMKIVLLVTMVPALLFAIILHEIAHGYVALLNGDRTAKINGRLTLNPVRHFDPIGFGMLMFLGFGYAKPVPINTLNFKRRRTGVFTVSIAGVAINFLLAFIFTAFFIMLLKFGKGSTFAFEFAFYFFSYFIWFNLILCFFNLLPLFPLDGFNLLSSFLSPYNKFLRFLRKYSPYILLFLLGLSIAVDYVNLPYAWWQNLDILGVYLNFFASRVETAFLWFWRLIFGL